jgi:hypothetical protein
MLGSAGGSMFSFNCLTDLQQNEYAISPVHQSKSAVQQHRAYVQVSMRFSTLCKAQRSVWDPQHNALPVALNKPDPAEVGELLGSMHLHPAGHYVPLYSLAGSMHCL